MPETSDFHADSSQELERLIQLEYGSHSEIVVRVLGMIVGATVLYAYTGWTLAWLWLGIFLLTQIAYASFLLWRIPNPGPRDETIAGWLFLALLSSFLWMPGVMICAPDRALSICGAALVGCILVFLVRRSDHARLMVLGEYGVVSVLILTVFFQLIPQFSNVYAKLGLILSGAALLFYFITAAHAARWLRIRAAEASQSSLQAEKMAAIGRLAGGVAHDFNNNLTAILGHLELLELLDDPAERKAAMAEATVAARQAARTVKQLLAFARKERMAMTPQDGVEVIEGLVALTRRLIPTSVATRVECGPSPQSFVADRAQLLAALINLVVNAVDAMPSGGEILLSCAVETATRPIDLADGTRLPAGTYVRIAVQDRGPGIPPHILPKVLEPFFTTKPAGKGTGLGLPMALGVSREFGGGLTIETSGQGTSVSIWLPHTPQ